MDLRYLKFNSEQQKAILKSLVILHDSREQKNLHIIKWLEANNIPHQKTTLKTGDYTAMIPKNLELGIPQDIYFHNVICIERKNGLEELSSNFVERKRIESEFVRYKGKLYLMVEKANMHMIYRHQYNSEFSPKCFVATLKCFEARYGINVNFISEDFAGQFIYDTLYYFIREILKGGNANGL